MDEEISGTLHLAASSFSNDLYSFSDCTSSRGGHSMVAVPHKQLIHDGMLLAIFLFFILLLCNNTI